MEISENGYQGEERKVSPFRKFLGVLANIFTFGIYGKIKRAKEQQEGGIGPEYFEEETPLIEQIRLDEIEAETGAAGKDSGTKEGAAEKDKDDELEDGLEEDENADEQEDAEERSL